MKSLTLSENTNLPADQSPGHPIEEASQAGLLAAGPASPSVWNETELTDAILTLCDEIPNARMVACWRTLEHCRRWTPRGTPESLMSAMRATLRRDIGSHGSDFATAA